MKRFVITVLLVLAVIGTSCLFGQGKGNLEDGLEWRTIGWIYADADTVPRYSELSSFIIRHGFGDLRNHQVQVGFPATRTDTRNEILVKEEAIARFLLGYFSEKDPKTLEDGNTLASMEQEILTVINTHILTKNKASAVRLPEAPQAQWWK